MIKMQINKEIFKREVHFTAWVPVVSGMSDSRPLHVDQVLHYLMILLSKADDPTTIEIYQLVRVIVIV